MIAYLYIYMCICSRNKYYFTYRGWNSVFFYRIRCYRFPNIKKLLLEIIMFI